MRIEAVETIRPWDHPNICIVQIHTDGMSGTGETFFGGDSIEAFIHEQAAPQLLGRNPLETRSLGKNLETYLGHTGSGVERRGRSAIDLALWDIVGKYAGVSLTTLLGGQAGKAVPAYNTCAGPAYVKNPAQQKSSNWGMESRGEYEDLLESIHQPGELALELVAEGFQAMKIWPFDMMAEKCNGTIPAIADIAEGIAPVRAIRDAVGDRIGIMVEMHGLWSAPGARLIIEALEEFSLTWIEDPIRPSGIDNLARIAESTSVPIAAGETIGDPAGYLEMMRRGAADVIVVDVGWCGGIGTALAIAQVADWHQLPVAFHDCSGPIQFAASVHLATAIENATHQEMVRAFYYGWYEDLVEGLPAIDKGYLVAPPDPGLGVELRAHVRDQARVRSTS